MNFEKEVIDRLARIEQSTEGLPRMHERIAANTTAIEVIKGTVTEHDRRICGIEGWGKWLVTAIGGLVIVAIWQIILG